MEIYKKFVVPALVWCVFIVIAIPLSAFILSLPLAQITEEGCSGFSGYQLTNCLAFYQREGDLEVLQNYAQAAIWILWIGLLLGGACSLIVLPHMAIPRTQKVIIPLLGLLTALLLAGLPLILFTELTVNGLIFALSLVCAFLSLEIGLASPTKAETVWQQGSISGDVSYKSGGDSGGSQ